MQPGGRDAAEGMLELGEGGNSEEHPPLQEDPGEEAAPEDLEEIETGTAIGPAAGAARRSPKKKKKVKPTIAAMEEDELKQIAQPPSEVIEELPSEEAMASRTMEGDSKEEKQRKKEAEKRR